VTEGAAAREDGYVLAIDLGTTGLKVGLVSLTGEVAWVTGAELRTRRVADGGAEQDPEEWWRLVSDAATAGLSSGAVRPGQVVAVSTTGQWASTVPVAADGTPVGPCVLWMDTRGGHHSRRRFGGPVSGYSPRPLITWVRRTGGAPSTSGADPIGHMLYLQHDRPEITAEARWFLEPVDYLSMRFTGHAAASPASMTAAWLTDNRRLDQAAYDSLLVRMAGIDTTRLPPLRPTASVIGTVRDDIAASLGLVRGAAVVAGTPDLHSASVGAGTMAEYQCHMAISTSAWISCPVGFKKTDVIRQIATVPGVVPGQYLVANNHETAGACLQWLRDRVIAPRDGLGAGPGGGRRGRGDGGSGPADGPAFAELTELAATAPPGAGGLLFTPWLTGERSPIDDRNARGGFHNASLDTDRAAMVRAVLEGVAYNNRWLHEAVEHFVKRPLAPVRVFGGGAQSDLWCQIHADVMNRTIERLADPVHANLRGAAILAGMALGTVGRSAAGTLAQVEKSFQPDPSRRAVYDRLYAEFPRLYRSQKGMFRRLNRPAAPGAVGEELAGLPVLPGQLLAQAAVDGPAHQPGHETLHPPDRGAVHPDEDVEAPGTDPGQQPFRDPVGGEDAGASFDGPRLGRLDRVLTGQPGSVGRRRVTHGNPDSVWPHLLPQALGETSDRVLAARIGGVSVQAHEPEHRRNIGDVARARPHETGQHGAGQPHHPQVVHREHVLERPHGEFLDPARVGVSGVADDDVQAAQVFARRRDPSLDRGLLPDVHLGCVQRPAGACEVLRGSAEPVPGPGGDANAGPLGEGSARSREPDAGGTAGDQNPCACETTHECAFRRASHHAAKLASSWLSIDTCRSGGVRSG
jgi:xylulokinase